MMSAPLLEAALRPAAAHKAQMRVDAIDEAGKVGVHPFRSPQVDVEVGFGKRLLHDAVRVNGRKGGGAVWVAIAGQEQWDYQLAHVDSVLELPHAIDRMHVAVSQAADEDIGVCHAIAHRV